MRRLRFRFTFDVELGDPAAPDASVELAPAIGFGFQVPEGEVDDEDVGDAYCR